MKSEVICVEVELAKNDAGCYRVRLSGDGFESVEDKFAFEVLANSQEKEKIGAIEEGTCDYEDLTYAGTRLWLGLMTGKCKTAWESLNQKRKVGDCVHLRLSLPAQPLSEDYPIDMRELPWEALYNPDVGSLAGDPNFCIIRQWRSETHIPELRSTAGRALRMLVIIPTASGLDAAQELTNIRHEGSKLAPPLEVEELVGAVTPNRLATTLENQDWDIV